MVYTAHNKNYHDMIRYQYKSAKGTDFTRKSVGYKQLVHSILFILVTVLISVFHRLSLSVALQKMNITIPLLITPEKCEV